MWEMGWKRAVATGRGAENLFGGDADETENRGEKTDRAPAPNVIFLSEYHTPCLLKDVVSAPNRLAGDDAYYNGPADPTAFEQKNALVNWPPSGDRLIVGRSCSLAGGWLDAVGEKAAAGAEGGR